MGSSSTTTQNNEPYAAAKPLLDQGLADAQAMYDQGGFNITPYQGDLVAQYDPYRAAADAATPGVVSGALGTSGAASGVLNRMMDPNYHTEALQGAKNAVIADIMPGINSSFAGSGRTGSGLHQQNLTAGLAQGLGQLEYDALNNANAQQMQAAGMVPTINNAAYGALDYLQETGANRQADAQSRIQADVFQDQQAKTAELNALQDYLSLSSGAGSMFGVQSSTSRSSPGLFGILGAGAQMAPFLFSDERLKTDIKRVGETDDGLPIYTYRYKGFDQVHMGVMAQDVERVKPEAVGEIGGYKAVDYGYL